MLLLVGRTSDEVLMFCTESIFVMQYYSDYFLFDSHVDSVDINFTFYLKWEFISPYSHDKVE